MAAQTGKQWPGLLKSAVLAMNSSYKKSHGQTPFKVMWGRESRCHDLLSYLNNSDSPPEQEEEEEDMVAALPENTDSNIEDEFSPPCDDDRQQSIAVLEESRELTRKNACESIRLEQLKQKRQYDKKVTEKRYICSL